MRDFAAIDFETANECRCSVCSVGVVIVRNGEIVDTFYSLIHPEPEYYQWFCQQVHGLSEEDTEDAPVFPYVWEKIAPLIEGLPLVAHNSNFDEGCLKECSKCTRWITRTTSSTTRWPPPESISDAAYPTISFRQSLQPAGMIWRIIITHWPMQRPVPTSQ